MSDYRSDIHCHIDPEQTEELGDGRLLQHVSVIMTERREPSARLGRYRPAPAICTLRPEDARELAFELIAAAEHAERFEEWSR